MLRRQFEERHPQAWGVAILRGIRVPPRKARLVVDLVRGKWVAEAEAILRHTQRGVAPRVLHALRSAAANAEQLHGLGREELYVHSVFVDEGPTMKRFSPRAMGKAGRIRKRSSNVTLFVVANER
ncbi:50S ribosomal protein L22 [Pasteuria penetrans]|uniref:50S ribosomal protein L22 n=1 Tax=Pasteuria penetrans TaxID=86005 RepID=UPI0011EEC0F8|nr:50S ribosomal protein L22 [Pasteuria penetrans]